MRKKSIHPTTHAIDRFEQRVIPELPESSRARLQDKESIKQSLYQLSRRAEITNEDNQMLQVQVFLTVNDHCPVPITLVLNPIKRVICTLYISPGWKNLGCEESPKWVCSQWVASLLQWIGIFGHGAIMAAISALLGSRTFLVRIAYLRKSL